MNYIWYQTLNKPPFTSPSDIFTPVWVILYIMMFLSFIYFLFTKTDKDKTQGIALFLTQLILNLLWSPIFFYWKNLSLSVLIIVLLVAFILATVISFSKISKISALLLIPYFLWVCFATYLTFGFMVLNT